MNSRSPQIVFVAAMITGVVAGAFIPLVPYLLMQGVPAFATSLLVSLAALALLRWENCAPRDRRGTRARAQEWAWNGCWAAPFFATTSDALGSPLTARLMTSLVAW